MVKLSPKDSSILTRITRYQMIPRPEREELLRTASAQAQEIGGIILGTSTGENVDPEIRAAAEAYQKSLQQTRQPKMQRPTRRTVAQ